MPMIPTILQSLNTAVLSDTLDSLGLMQQAMKPFIRPLDDTLQLFGRARTGLYMPVYAPPAPGENPYEVEIALVDQLAPGEVVVLAYGRRPHRTHRPLGELLSTASMARGAAGCVTDGLVRDVKQIRDMRFPVFCGGIGHRYQRPRANGRSRRPGDVRRCERRSDLVFGDVDGVVVIPHDAEQEVVRRRTWKRFRERTSRARRCSKGKSGSQTGGRHETSHLSIACLCAVWCDCRLWRRQWWR